MSVYKKTGVHDYHIFSIYYNTTRCECFPLFYDGLAKQSINEGPTQTHTVTLSLPAFTVFHAESAVILWAELAAGGGKLVFFVSTLEARQNALAKQILPQLHLQEMTGTQVLSQAQLVGRSFCCVQSQKCVSVEAQLCSHQIHRGP